MRDAADTLTAELPGLPPATPAPRLRPGMVVRCDGIACRVTTVMRGGREAELRTLLGELVGVRPIAELSRDMRSSR